MYVPCSMHGNDASSSLSSTGPRPHTSPRTGINQEGGHQAVSSADVRCFRQPCCQLTEENLAALVLGRY